MGRAPFRNCLEYDTSLVSRNAIAQPHVKQILVSRQHENLPPVDNVCLERVLDGPIALATQHVFLQDVLESAATQREGSEGSALL